MTPARPGLEFKSLDPESNKLTYTIRPQRRQHYRKIMRYMKGILYFQLYIYWIICSNIPNTEEVYTIAFTRNPGWPILICTHYKYFINQILLKLFDLLSNVCQSSLHKSSEDRIRDLYTQTCIIFTCYFSSRTVI